MKLSFLFENRLAQQRAAEQVQRDACHFRLSSKFRFYYRFLRPVMPIAVRQILQRGRRIETEGRWFEPIAFMHSITECLASVEEQLTTIHPWPDGCEFAFVLTHDVETAEGMQRIAQIADVEESLGLRSSWNLVPYKYRIDMGLVSDLQSRGFEIGIHGYNHDGRLYSSRKEFDRRAIAINQAVHKYGASGFRSPMVHRNLNWLQSLDIQYDSSCFDIDPYQAAPGGVGTVWPFIAGRLVELPYTLPQDHTLFVALGERDDRIWREKLDYIVRYQGMALMLTHPDYLTGQRELDIYVRFLEYVKTREKFWHATPIEVAQWWREREQALEFDLTTNRTSMLELPNGNRYVIADFEINGDSLQIVSR